MCLLPVSVLYVCTNHEVLGELSSARNEKDNSTVPGAGIYKNDVLFQIRHVYREIHALKGNDRVRNACC
jgi:hypothetical protein